MRLRLLQRKSAQFSYVYSRKEWSKIAEQSVIHYTPTEDVGTKITIMAEENSDSLPEVWGKVVSLARCQPVLLRQPLLRLRSPRFSPYPTRRRFP